MIHFVPRLESMGDEWVKKRDADKKKKTRTKKELGGRERNNRL